MNYYKQDDFDNFKCIAGDCPKSCCTGWQIVIDDESAERYQAEKGVVGELLAEGIDFEEQVFLQNNGRCSMLDKAGLCKLQIVVGEEILCDTCKAFPRHTEEYEDVREFSLSLACPEAARMAVERIEPMTIVAYEDSEEDDFEDFDYLMYTKLVDAREIIFNIIQDRNVSLLSRMAKVQSFGQELEKCVDEDRFFEIDDVLDDYSRSRADKFSYEVANIDILYKLEILDDEWQNWLDDATLFVRDKDIGEIVDNLSTREQVAFEQILFLLIYTYFCGAVYDDWVYSKIALCIYSVQWMICIYRSRSEAENLEVLIETVYRYAREVEHSDLNLDFIEETFSF